MRAPSAFLRSLSLRRRSPEAVAPLPVKTQFDHQLTAELDSLRPQGTNESKFASATGLVQLLDASLNTQKIALELFVNSPYREDTDRRALDEYLEDNTDVLDTCNYLVEKIEVVYKFVDSMRVVARMVDSGAKPESMARNKRVLDHLESSCQAMERECKEMSKRGSCLRRMLKQKLAHETELSEIICGSKAMALVVCKFLELSLSFDSKHRLPTILQSHPMSSSWVGLLQDLEKQVVKEASEKKSTTKSGPSLMMVELQQTMAATRDLQEQIKGKREKELKSCVDRLKRSCRKLEDGLVAIEGKVKDLYKNLINIRMALLGVVSQQ
ncbi:hypothetical protein L6164_006229 [Bauhinia variegata]|uniref:Uncharacterized protein n=1 Tax=Bauhinia variegata TaxID=167791 RepID=A0ACB9PUD1_BAUVA|nr:hypothetical protein L6164_006229 [Bauhinia variegata]